MNLILRVLRTWPRMMAKGFQLPPMFHPALNTSEDLPVPLANCFTLTRMWDGQCKDSADIVQATIEQEMNRLLNEVGIAPFGIETLLTSSSTRITMKLTCLQHCKP
jgi:hypothetical protein